MESELISYFTHPSSVVDYGAKVGSGTSIWHFCHISSTAQIGKNCVLGQNVYIGPQVIIGDGVKIQNNVSIYEGVIVEDDVFIGPSVVFTNIKEPRAYINQKDRFKSTLIEKGASIGANSTIICGNTIGQYAMIGAGSVVTRDIPEMELWYGNPARFIENIK